MPKSDEVEKNSAKKPRVGKRNRDEIAAYGNVLEHQCGLFAELLKEMKALKIEDVEFDGINKMDRAQELIDEFIDAVDIAVRRTKRQKERGQ